MAQGNESRPLPREETQTSEKIRPGASSPTPPQMRAESWPLGPLPSSSRQSDPCRRSPSPRTSPTRSWVWLGLGACAQLPYFLSLYPRLERRYLTSVAHGEVLSILWKELYWESGDLRFCFCSLGSLYLNLFPDLQTYKSCFLLPPESLAGISNSTCATFEILIFPPRPGPFSLLHLRKGQLYFSSCLGRKSRSYSQLFFSRL